MTTANGSAITTIDHTATYSVAATCAGSSTLSVLLDCGHQAGLFVQNNDNVHR